MDEDEAERDERGEAALCNTGNRQLDDLQVHSSFWLEAALQDIKDRARHALRGVAITDWPQG